MHGTHTVLCVVQSRPTGSASDKTCDNSASKAADCLCTLYVANVEKDVYGPPEMYPKAADFARNVERPPIIIDGRSKGAVTQGALARYSLYCVCECGVRIQVYGRSSNCNAQWGICHTEVS